MNDELFDSEDVEVGPYAPEGDEQTEEELLAVQASQADPATPPADAAVS